MLQKQQQTIQRLEENQAQQAREIEEHEHHDEIIAALKSGDRAAAQRALILDIDRSFRILMPED